MPSLSSLNPEPGLAGRSLATGCSTWCVLMVATDARWATVRLLMVHLPEMVSSTQQFVYLSSEPLAGGGGATPLLLVT